MQFPAIPSLEGKRESLLALVCFALGAILVYGRTLAGGLVVDDWWWAGKQVGHGWMANDHAPLFYRPTVSAIYWLLWTRFGPSGLAFHVLNLSCMILTAFGIFTIVQQLTDRRWVVGLVAGGLFVLNPSHPEAVCWGAGMTDTISATLAIWGIAAILEFCRTAHIPWLLGGLAILALGLFAKESVVLAPVMSGCLALFLPNRKVRGKAFGAAGFCVLALIPIYVVLRSKMVTGGVGGYSAIHWDSLIGTLMRAGGLVLSNNSFLPIYSALWYKAPLNRLFDLHQLLFAFVPASLSLGLQKSLPVQMRFRAVASMGLLGLLAYGLFLPVFTFIQAASEFASLLPPALLVAAVGLAFLFWRENGVAKCKRGLEYLRRHPKIWFGGLAIVGFYLVMNSPIAVEYIVPLVWCAGLGFQRSPHLAGGKRFDETARLCGLALISLLLWILAVGPALHLPMGLDGQQSRFAYFGSCFAAIALACVLRLLPRYRFAFGAATGLWCLLALWQSTGAWQEAGTISNQSVEALRHMKGADRIVVLGVPATVDGALVFLGGFEEIPRVMFGSKIRPLVLYRMHFATHGDRWQVRRLDRDTFFLQARMDLGPRFKEMQVLPPEKGSEGVLTQGVGNGTLIKIPGMTANTRVLSIDASGVTILN